MSAPDRYSLVGASIWRQPWSDDARTVAFYVLTCEHRHTEGIYRLPRAYAYADLDWPPKRYDKAFEELVADGFVQYDNDAQVVLIVNALKWQRFNANQAKGMVNRLRTLPRTVLLARFATLAATHSEPLTEALAEGFPQGFGEG